MAVSNSDAIRIFKKYFRNPIYNMRLRKYSFQTVGVSMESVEGLHKDLYLEGSKISREEILRFIDQTEEEYSIPFRHLPFKYILPGEVVEVVHAINSTQSVTLRCIRLSNSHWLCSENNLNEFKVFKPQLIKLSPESVFAEQEVSPILPQTTIISVNLLPPPPFFRNLDYILLDERYAENKPQTVMPLYSSLILVHSSNSISQDWNNILDQASSLGISLFTVFCILDYFTKYDG